MQSVFFFFFLNMFWSNVSAGQWGIWEGGALYSSTVQNNCPQCHCTLTHLWPYMNKTAAGSFVRNSQISETLSFINFAKKKKNATLFSFFQQRLHFYDAAPSPFSQSHKSTTQRHPSNQSDGSSTPSAVFPWGRDDSRPAPRRQSPSSPQATGADVTNRQQAQLGPGGCGKESDYRRDADSECRRQMVSL